MTMNDLVYCNCAECGRLLLGAKCLRWWKRQTKAARIRRPPLVAGRVLERPYCAMCLELAAAAQDVEAR